MQKNYIPENISYLLSKESHLTQDEFGNLFDLKRGSINSYVNKKSTPKIETLLKICDYYNLSLDQLVRVSLLEKKYTDRSNEKPDTLGEPPEGYGIISLKYVELLERSVDILEKSIEDKDKLISVLTEQNPTSGKNSSA